MSSINQTQTVNACVASLPHRKAKKQVVSSVVNAPLNHITNTSLPNNLRCYYTNANSLNNKRSSLNALAAVVPRPHIIAITESWFNESSCSHIDGFHQFIRNRNDGQGYGGVALFIDTELETFEVDHDSAALACDDVEQTWIGVKSGTDKLLIGCIYRPPPKAKDDSEKRAKLENALLKSVTEAKRLVERGKYNGMCICGDFNFNKTKWDSDGVATVYGGAGVRDHSFIDMLENQHIHQAITFPTFCNSKGKRVNFLDLVLADSIDRVVNVELGPPLSDTCKQFHVSINFEIAVRGGQRNPTFERSSLNYAKGDYRHLNQELNSVDWASLFNGKDTNECYELFLSEYDRACNLWIPPSNKLKRKAQPPWMNGPLAALIANKKRLWILMQRTRSRVASIRAEYKATCKMVKKATKRSVIDFERNLIRDKKNSKRFFGYVKSKQKTNSSITAMRGPDGNTIHNGNQISNILNAYFKSVFVDEDETSELPDSPSRTDTAITSVSLDVTTSAQD